MKVSEIMSHPVITVREDATLEEVARIMLDHRFGSVPVVNEPGTMIGIITESDFAAKAKEFPLPLLRCHKSLDIGWVSQASNKCISRRARFSQRTR